MRTIRQTWRKTSRGGLFPLIIAFAMSSCQPAIQSRQAIEPAWTSADGYTLPMGSGRRLRVGEYEVTGFKASAAARHWPLMDSRTLSHRYGFEIAGEGRNRRVQCLLLSITGEESRERTILECTVSGEESWQIRLAGRHTLDGTLAGSSRRYDVRWRSAAEKLPATEYHVLASEIHVATIPGSAAGEPWIAPELAGSDRDAVAATVVAMIAGRELTHSGL